MRMKRTAVLAVAPIFALALAACGSSTSSAPASSAPAAASSAAAPASSAAAAATSAAAAETPVKKIAFFGFWKSNSFTQAVLAGVQKAADAQGIEVVDLTTAEYDGAAQIKAVQDQTVKGDAQMYVVLASDSVGMATAAKEAIDAGVNVVAAFTPLGPDFTTLDPQVPGLVVVGETPVDNGKVLAEMAISACADLNPCNVAYLEGLKALPLDNARTESFVKTLAAGDPNAKIVAQVEGGYSPDTGKKAAQDALQANPDINVMVGSSQAILGAQGVVDTSKVKLIGNGSSKEAFDAVNSGQWYALYNMDVEGMGSKSVENGLANAAGTLENPAFNTQDLRDPHGTKDVIANYTSSYSDLG
jgi:ribose transport system substrate-binding protein